MDWERSTEERSVSSEISADYRLPPDPVSPPFSGEPYIYIYIFPIYYWLLFILVSSLCSAFLYTYIYIHILYIDNRLAHSQSSAGAARCGWGDDPLRQVPSSCNCNYALQCIVLHHYYDRITADHSWRATRYDDRRDFEVDAYKRTLLHLKVRRWSHTHVHARTHACMCMCVEFTLHVGLLHVPKCFAVCCSPC